MTLRYLNSRSTLPSPSVSPGAARIEAWRSAGQFHFDMVEDFPSPPAALADVYDSGPEGPREEWKYDCSTTDGTSSVLTGELWVL